MCPKSQFAYSSRQSKILERWNVAVPRYTSYPTATSWKALDPSLLASALLAKDPRVPLSLYLHIPFCHARCLYCGCAVVINRQPEEEKKYVEALLKEIDHAHALLASKTSLHQIHFGGGSPSKLSSLQLGCIIESVRKHFEVTNNTEIAIEIDPRTMTFEKLQALKEFGINRISLGVQDLDGAVQEAIGRRQPAEMSIQVFEMARSLQFASISIDLIYGLPQQTCSSFVDTIDKIIALQPDRVSLFSFAYLPHLLPHQRELPPPPPADEKFLMYTRARRRFLQHGFVGIGMDHFAAPSDPLSSAARQGRLRRNFQGYTNAQPSDLLGIGMTAISTLREGFFQHPKTLSSYYEGVEKYGIPCDRGGILSLDDRIRQWVIEQIMCSFRVEKKAFKEIWGIEFDTYFQGDLPKLIPLIEDGLVENSHESIATSKKGFFFVRNLGSCFDAFLGPCCGGSNAI